MSTNSINNPLATADSITLQSNNIALFEQEMMMMSSTGVTTNSQK
jgi:hypothetical protein